MKLFSVIKKVFLCQTLCVSDRMDTAETKFTLSMQNFPELTEIQSILALVPQRDEITLAFTNDSGDIAIITNHGIDLSDLSNLLEGQLPDDDIEVSVSVNKTVKYNRFTIYDFISFAQYLQSRPLTDVLSWFASQLASNDSIVFEVYDNDISFATGTMAFVSKENVEFKPKINRYDRLQMCKNTSSFYNMDIYEVLPEDFLIEGVEHSNNPLRPLFGRLSTILSVAYAVPSASIEKATLNVNIDTHRTMRFSIAFSDLVENPQWLLIYRWIFDGSNHTDKALIAHNAMNLHCKYSGLFDIDERLIGTIETHHALYLKENVDRYLSLKRELSDYIQNVVSQVGEYTTSIFVQFKKNLIAIFGFVFTIALTGIGRVQGWENIFSRDALYIIQVVLLGSLLYLVACIVETKYRLKKTKDTYATLKKNYEDILSPIDMKQAFGNDELLVSTVKTIQKGMAIWSIIWALLLLSAIAIIEFLTFYGGVFTWIQQRLC